MSSRKKSGRAFNGAARDAGSIVHDVPDENYPSWEKARCGTTPGIRGNGWQPPEKRAVTCVKCLEIRRNPEVTP